jgi:Uma2 family endonuclease
VIAPPTRNPSARVHYPESDGQPLGETGFHVDATLTLYGLLREFLARAPDTYVAADMFLYYEEGNPAAATAPDVMAIRGVGKQTRRTFKVWLEGAVPCTVIEVTSRSTRREDQQQKRELYERLGIDEYFMFDPLGEYLHPPLLGFRLVESVYVPMTPRADGSLPSHALRCALLPDGPLLRVVDLDTGVVQPLLGEAMREADEARAEIERLRRELELAGRRSRSR